MSWFVLRVRLPNAVRCQGYISSKTNEVKDVHSRHEKLFFLSIPVVDSCDAVIELKAFQLFAKWKPPFVILGEVRNEVLSEFERSFLLKGLVCVCGTLYASIFDCVVWMSSVSKIEDYYVKRSPR